MAFIQIVEMRTQNVDEIIELDRQWEKATEGKRTLRRAIVGRDRNDPERHVIIAFFDDHESAMQNSNLPETQEFAAKQSALADAVQFIDLDVIDDRS
jgi:quinol monooxygenase YgiN